MSEFVIEKGLEPTPKATRGKGSKYPFAQMEPGDSFLVQGDDKQKPRLQVRLSGAVGRTAIRQVPDSKWTTRQVEGGVRVWRIA